MEEIIYSLSHGKGRVNFEQFIRFMVLSPFTTTDLFAFAFVFQWGWLLCLFGILPVFLAWRSPCVLNEAVSLRLC
jgi:hypothetical protein